MMFSCKLADVCMNCPNAHIDVRNETVWPSGAITPQLVKSTLYCRHMAVCHQYLNANDGDRMILVPLADYIEATSGPNYAEEEEEGDGINE